MKPMPLHLNHLFFDLKPIWPGTWYLIAIPIFLTPLCCILEVHIWNVVAYFLFPADGVSHLLSTFYLFKHWQKLEFAQQYFDCNFKNVLTPMCYILEVHILSCCFAHFLSFLLMVFLICCQRSIFSSIDKSWDLQRSIDR